MSCIFTLYRKFHHAALLLLVNCYDSACTCAYRLRSFSGIRPVVAGRHGGGKAARRVDAGAGSRPTRDPRNLMPIVCLEPGKAKSKRAVGSRLCQVSGDGRIRRAGPPVGTPGHVAGFAAGRALCGLYDLEGTPTGLLWRRAAWVSRLRAPTARASTGTCPSPDQDIRGAAPW